jgi:hypothetical protein
MKHKTQVRQLYIDVFKQQSSDSVALLESAQAYQNCLKNTHTSLLTQHSALEFFALYKKATREEFIHAVHTTSVHSESLTLLASKCNEFLTAMAQASITLSCHAYSPTLGDVKKLMYAYQEALKQEFLAVYHNTLASIQQKYDACKAYYSIETSTEIVQALTPVETGEKCCVSLFSESKNDESKQKLVTIVYAQLQKCQTNDKRTLSVR